MPMHQSVALLNMPVEFINVQPLNPLISSCDVKVLYHGKNRNRSYISKPVANVMANTLPNVPIVGQYLEEIKDFGDHGEELVIDSKGVRFRKKTKAFGMVPSDTKIWWQWFCDDDGVSREYMMCKGYLWTGRYPETYRILEKGNGQSMELDPDTLQGQWATLQNEEGEYFIVDEAIFSALCILGENIEPCFEGSNITAPSVAYSLDKNDFKLEMSQFMLDLKNALNSLEGGEKMSVDNTNINTNEDQENQDNGLGTDFVQEPDSGQAVVTDPVDNSTNNEGQEESSDFAAENNSDNDDSGNNEGNDGETSNYTLEEVVEYQELLIKYQELETKYNAVVQEIDGIKPEFNRLQQAEAANVKKAKETMISKFSILDEEDLKDVKDNIDSYSLDQIESKLSVIAVRKKVNFNLDNKDNLDSSIEDPIVSFNVNQNSYDSAPAWIKAVEARTRK